MHITVKSLIKLAIPAFLLFFAGLCFPQAGSKAPAAAPKAPAASPKAAAAPAQDQAAKPQPKPEADEAIPPAAPNAIFPAVVARVNGKAVLGRDLEELVRRELSSIGNPEWKSLREDYRGPLTLNFLTTLINSKLIYQKAVASGTKATDAEVQAEFQKIAKTFKSDAEMNIALAEQNTDRATLEKNLYETLTMAKYVSEAIDKKIAVTPEELSKYYSGNPDEFKHPDIVRTSHILIPIAGDTAEQGAKAKERAEALLARIKKGEDFAKLAKENSVDASASQGGDIGFNSKDSLTPEYSDAAFSLPVGGMKVIKTQYGYHVIKVTEKKKEGVSALEEVKDQLTEFLKNQKSQAELTKLVNQLRNQAKIEILIPAGQPLNP
jgi:peptidyl-prolyl cis-trans isomerase C